MLRQGNNLLISWQEERDVFSSAWEVVLICYCFYATLLEGIYVSVQCVATINNTWTGREH